MSLGKMRESTLLTDLYRISSFRDPNGKPLKTPLTLIRQDLKIHGYIYYDLTCKIFSAAKQEKIKDGTEFSNIRVEFKSQMNAKCQ